MKTLSGAVLILASGVMFAGAAIADSSRAPGQSGDMAMLAAVSGGLAGFIGLVVLAIGILTDLKPGQRENKRVIERTTPERGGEV